jgi:transketolase
MARSAAPSVVPDLDALRGRARIIRRHIVEMLHEAASGHPGGSLSAVEIVTALYFGGFLRYDPARPDWAGPRPLHPVEGARRARCSTRRWPKPGTFRLRAAHAAPHRQPAAGPPRARHCCRASRRPPARSGRACPSARHGAGRRIDGATIASSCCSATASARKARCGKPPWPPATTSRTTSSPSSTTTSSSSTAPSRTSSVSSRSREVGVHGLADVREIDGHDMAEVCRGPDVGGQRGRTACIIAHTIKGKGVSFMEGRQRVPRRRSLGGGAGACAGRAER